LETPDYYGFLQISPIAEPDTIHRVYRFLAARLHPDNSETGDADKFFLLKKAYDILSNPARRATYDAAREKNVPQPDPLSATIDFLDSIDGELNRRLAVLAVLYIRRRTNPASPEVSLMEVEERMGFPRDYLEFTTWYLQQRGYITRADNSAFTLTADGVDFVENQRANIPVLDKLLTSGAGPTVEDTEQEDDPFIPRQDPIIVSSGMAIPRDRRTHRKDRRANLQDRRKNSADRRANPTDRRAS
jgi:curved DNA-binding protein CbpA